MRGWHLKPLPAVLLVATVAFELAAVGLSWDLESRYDTLLYAFYSVVQVAAGAFVASRHPRNPIGWLFCGFGALNALTADLAQGWGLRAAEQGWPGGPAAEWVSEASWLPGGVGLILTFLLFPDGRLLESAVASGALDRRHRLRACAAGLVSQPRPGDRVRGRAESARDDRDPDRRPARRRDDALSRGPGRLGSLPGRPLPPLARRRAPPAHVVHLRRRSRGHRPAARMGALVCDARRTRACCPRPHRTPGRREHRDPALPPL